MSEIEIRSAQVVDVSYPKRTVTVIVTPYDTPTEIHTRRGGSYTEIVSRGAYDGVQRRSMRANRDHDWGRLCGKVTGLYPDRDEGLVADVKMFNHGEGPPTLELCAEDGLSASAGFALMREHGYHGPIKPGAETWERNRTVRRLNHLYLDHVAFVPDPAYEASSVIDVRHAAAAGELVATPNLLRLELDELRAKMAAIDRRYGV